MCEELALTPQEMELIDREDEITERLEKEAAFRDFLSINERRPAVRDIYYPHFKPRSMDDYRYIDPWGRVNALEFCLETARSERFAPERMERLAQLNSFVDKLEPDDYCCLRSIVRLYRDGADSKQLEISLSNCDDMADWSASESYVHPLWELCNAVANERRKYLGYLRLARQLVLLGNAGVPDEIIPRQAFFMSYPPEGEEVIAWSYSNSRLEDQGKRYGVIPYERHLDLYEIMVDPPEEVPEYIRDLQIAPLNYPLWFYNVVPAKLVKFYQERPELLMRHREVLQMPHLDYIEELVLGRQTS